MNQIQILLKHDKIWTLLKLLSYDQLGIGMMPLKQPLSYSPDNDPFVRHVSRRNSSVTTVLIHQKKHTLPCALRHIKLCLIQIN